MSQDDQKSRKMPSFLSGWFSMHSYLRGQAFPEQRRRVGGEGPYAPRTAEDGDGFIGLIGFLIIGVFFYGLWLVLSLIAGALQAIGLPVTAAALAVGTLVTFITFSTLVTAELIAIFLLPPRWRIPWVPLWAVGVVSVGLSAWMVASTLGPEMGI